jgi:hypothetical protein
MEHVAESSSLTGVYGLKAKQIVRYMIANLRSNTLHRLKLL